ncbi:MAG: Calcineurin-like phosphoesterase [Candidatus Accumulibacter regalis]|uniref:Calcineurin-like phosphoesterase n=2 Tax=Candidatus Accumulibacter TaxID=327159 RepID=A0A011PAD4_ACCRE|nr:MAG: Calcineurin-like phosphoesterase [Candidatus Accumulibacter regalis]HRI91178.1 metallophosphoesterase [Accumulibacter sp.]
MTPNMFAKIAGLTLALAVCSEVAHAAESSAVKASRDWLKHPAVVELDTTETVFAVGDPHGDPVRLAGVLAAAMLTESTATAPDQVKWTGGKSVLVVTGDMIDKWTDSLGVIALLRALQTDAARQGGQVIVTMGNHEAEFLANPLGKKTREFANELRAAKIDPVEVASCQGDVGQFLCALPIAVRVNDWFFSHGGNTNNRTIAELSTAIENGFAKDGFATKELSDENSILEARLNKKGPNGMPWFMDGSKDTDAKALLKKYASKLKVNHIVQGHQYGRVKFPDNKNREEETLFQRYGILFLIDSGMGEGIEDSTSTGGALRIAGPAGKQQALVICANGYWREMWDSKEQPDHQEQHCGK